MIIVCRCVPKAQVGIYIAGSCKTAADAVIRGLKVICNFFAVCCLRFGYYFYIRRWRITIRYLIAAYGTDSLSY
ncbi:MAG: hypothetical protein WDA68_09980 [Phycisphaerae bacterium]